MQGTRGGPRRLVVGAGAKPVPPGPCNPFGTRWMGLDPPGVGIHGTPDAASIGYCVRTAASGCRSPRPSGSSSNVDVGTPVVIL